MLDKGKEKTRVILFCGLSNAGKTTVLNIFTKGDVFKTGPTLGVSLNTLSFKDMNFRIFDLGGQKKFREEITPLLPFADLIVFVIDSGNKKRFREVKDEFERVLRNSNKKLTPICILNHKSDLRKTMKQKYMLKKLGLKKVLDRQWEIFNTSAVTLEGLKDAFSWIYEQTVGEKFEFKVDRKKEKEYSFFYPCPMMKEEENSATYCLNRDEFIETELTNFGFHDEVNKMVLKILPELKAEAEKNSGRLVCPDFCILKNGENILKCPVTNYQIETRGIKVSQKRYEDALVLSQIYGAKIGTDICRECIYKIIISPDSILTEEDLREFSKTLM